MASNLFNATREMLDKTWQSGISWGSPFFTRLVERGQVVPGGLRYEQIKQNNDLTSLVQLYGPNDPLQGGSAEIMEKPHWHVAYAQLPIEESVDERVMNAPAGDPQLVKIRDKIAEEAPKSLKRVLTARMYGCATDIEFDADHTMPQGLVSALLEDVTYGGLTRTHSSSTNTWWQSADYENWDTASTINKSNLDEWLHQCMEFDDEAGSYMVLMGPTLWRRLKQILEASNYYEPKANRATQGFDSMTYNGVEIAMDFTLDRMTHQGYAGRTTILTPHNGSKTINSGIGASTHAGLTGHSSTHAAGSTYVFVVNLDTWHLRYWQDPDGTGPFEMTEFFDQDKIIGGVEKSLARVKWKGNITCDMPNRNLMRANVS